MKRFLNWLGVVAIWCSLGLIALEIATLLGVVQAGTGLFPDFWLFTLPPVWVSVSIFALGLLGVAAGVVMLHKSRNLP